ncbi:CATRA conflict system CASPASE/TPR repeat-associated protein [Amycolatopsis sp. NPDC051371]|uniref:CATRA conflict system CASPASE/TPR repeat-associated protein n=1 Tax=Amycolatopsis sp. NPDC051371 TaxID=3155800 RepID=UPI00342C0BF4
MTDPLTGHEVVAHVYAPLDGPDADRAYDLVRRIWLRCRRTLGTTQGVAGTRLPADLPSDVPAAKLFGSLLIAAQEDGDRRAQAIVRREHDVLGLSILRKGPPDSWLDLGRDLRVVLGDDLDPLIGQAVLYLAKVPDVASGPEPALLAREHLPPLLEADDWWHRGRQFTPELTLWEVSPEPDDRALRDFVVLADPRHDRELGDWVWAFDGRPAMPRLARYLMHMAKLRYELRVWSKLPQAGDLAQQVGSGAIPLGETIVAIGAMRHTVEIAEDNAVSALAKAGGYREPGVDPISDDRALSAWFTRQLEDNLDYLETFREGARRRGLAKTSRGVVERRATEHRADEPGALRVLVIADEWFPARGGISAFNRSLCIALAANEMTVFCVALNPSAEELADAAGHGVHLIEAAQEPGMAPESALLRRPRLPDATAPDVIIGHGRITGPAAKTLAVDLYPEAVWLHVVHMEPDRLEWHRPDRGGDAGERADVRSRIELELGREATRAIAVGPRLAQWLERDFSALDSAPPPALRVDPGFDSAGVERKPPPGVPQILMMGRMEDIPIKGVDLGAKAIGRAARLGRPGARWELLVRGAAEGVSAALQKKVARWIDHAAVSVVVRPYTSHLPRVGEDLRRASLLLLPSRAEGFGLVGLEAIVAGTPVLVSDQSGLGVLLREVLPREQGDRVVVPVDDRESDVELWGARISAALLDREGAFATAAAVRDTMARERTWSAVAAGIRKLYDEIVG